MPEQFKFKGGPEKNRLLFGLKIDGVLVCIQGFWITGRKKTPRAGEFACGLPAEGKFEVIRLDVVELDVVRTE